MKFIFIYLFVFLINVCSLKAQHKFNSRAEFDDGSIVDYSILENNPYTYPNLSIALGIEFNTLTNVANEVNYTIDLKYLLPKLGAFNFFFSRGFGIENSKAINTRSDNPVEVYTEIGGGITIDVFNKVFPIEKKLTLKSSEYRVKHVIPYDHLINRRIGIDAGYYQTIGLITNYSRKKDDNAFHALSTEDGTVLVPDNYGLDIALTPTLETKGGVVHSALRTNILFAGGSFETSYHIKLITDQRKKPIVDKYKWGCHLHLLYAPRIGIDPVVFNADKDIIVGRNPTYVSTIPQGTYDINNNFQIAPWGFKVGAFTGINFSSAVELVAKIEAGILPGVDGYERGGQAFNDSGRFYLSIGIALAVNISAPKFPANYKL